MTVLLFKLVFSFKNNAQHLTFVTVCETDFFFFHLKHLIYLISVYIILAFGSNLSVTVQANLCHSSLQSQFL